MDIKEVIVGKPINGISLNGNEWLLDENDDIMVFDNKKVAITFLEQYYHDFTEEDFEDNFVFESPAIKQFEL